jgi:CheY-like chemotaxis protein
MATLASPTEMMTPPDAADLARSLATPLQSLLAMGEQLQRQPLTKTAEMQVQALLNAGRRMARLLYDTIETSTVPAHAAGEPTMLKDLIDDIDAHWRARSNGRAAQVMVSCNAPTDLRVMIDPARMQRLLNTLIEDALDGAAWGTVELQLQVRLEAGGGVVLSGRLEAPGCKLPGGRSVALDLCSVIAAQLGGGLYATENPGSGVLTTFDLPLLQADLDAPQDDDAEGPDGPLPPRTHLLIVDDNATNRIVAAALCEMFGCTSETAEDGVEAVEAAASRNFDLILMDIKMPRMDGLEATRAIRALPGPAASTPIVALTANADPDAVATYLAGGMQAVVDKPIKPDQLLATLQQVLRDRTQEPERRVSAA